MKSYELKEKSQHGTKEFPLAIYHPDGLLAHYHWHDECEFIYINSGSANIRIEEENYHLREGQCAYVPSQTLHSIFTADYDKLDFYAIVFHPSLLFSDIDICNKYFAPNFCIKRYFSPIEKENKIIETLRQVCHTYEIKAFGYELKIKAGLICVLSDIFEYGMYHREASSEHKKSVERLEKVLQFIHANCLTKITAKELAEVSGYSVSHFTHFFKELTGKTPVDYINQQRINHACRLLKETRLSVLEVSLECGFEHTGHFIKTFQRYTQCTPYKYKQKSLTS